MWFGRQPKGWMQTMFSHAAVDQLHHLAGQEPAFAGLVADGDDRRRVMSELIDFRGRREMRAPDEFIVAALRSRLTALIPAVSEAWLSSSLP